MSGNINSIIHLALPGESDVTLEFSESDMVRDIFGKMDTLNCLYTAQITPRTDQDSLEIFVFERESESHLRIFSAIKVFNKRYVVTCHRSQVTGLTGQYEVTTGRLVRRRKRRRGLYSREPTQTSPTLSELPWCSTARQ